MKKAAFKELLQSIDELRDVLAGRRQPSRVIKFDPLRVKTIRKKLHVSQSRFATLIGVSAATLRNWEQGRTRPGGAARALLMVAERQPRAVIEALMESDFPTGKVRFVKDFLPPPGQLKIPSQKPQRARKSQTRSSS